MCVYMYVHGHMCAYAYIKCKSKKRLLYIQMKIFSVDSYFRYELGVSVSRHEGSETRFIPGNIICVWMF